MNASKGASPAVQSNRQSSHFIGLGHWTRYMMTLASASPVHPSLLGGLTGLD